jgi:MFS family permease
VSKWSTLLCAAQPVSMGRMDAAHATPVAHSPWSPFRHTAFTIIWIATLVSNIGGWMYSSASAWLMSSLDPNPLLVSLVQVATTLPMMLFALPAGALADIIDKRRFLIGAECFIAVVCTLFAALVWLRLITLGTLLLFIFLIESGSAAAAPAWQSVVSQLVPRQELPAAVAMNSAGINLSRALGPALGGFITVAFGIAAPFWINGVSNFGVIAALLSRLGAHPAADAAVEVAERARSRPHSVDALADTGSCASRRARPRPGPRDGRISHR